MHEKAPPEVFTLVLEELKELFGGGNGNVKAKMIAGGVRIVTVVTYLAT